jgi:anti-sigma regulatory factor (Ser/Thr protein kinase)
MTAPPILVRPHSSYQHEALFYHGMPALLAGTVSFIRDGLASDQPVMVVLAEPRLGALRTALGADAERVRMLDMARVGANPARIIPTWQEFLDNHDEDQPIRGIGEPVWFGRRAVEIAESQLHEALLNLAVDPDRPFWLRCPYDADALPADVVDAAHHSHPVLVEADDYRGSTCYGGVCHAEEMFSAHLPEPAATSVSHVFDGMTTIDAIKHAAAEGTDLGIDGERVADLTAALGEILDNSIRHGGGGGTLRIWHDQESFVCEVRDAGRIEDSLIGRRRPGEYAGRPSGLWLVNLLCDLVQVRSSLDGTTVRLVTWLPSAV